MLQEVLMKTFLQLLHHHKYTVVFVRLYFINLSLQCSYDVLKFRSNLSFDVLINDVSN